jgi:RecG-like helicase
MKNTYDGFAIAERDLMMRGPGDFFGSGTSGTEHIRQSGEGGFKMSGMCSDEGLMSSAFEDARLVYCGELGSPQEKTAALDYAKTLYRVEHAALN